MKSEKSWGDNRSENGSEATLQEQRREFLAKCARFAAYTAPAVLLLLNSSKAEASVAIS